MIGPSNPVISIGPILALPGMREALRAAPAPVVAVSPFVGGRSLKGPTEAFCRQAGIELSAAGIARAYAGVVDGVVADEPSGAAAELVTDTLIDTAEARAPARARGARLRRLAARDSVGSPDPPGTADENARDSSSKELPAAKQRLADALGAGSRQALAQAMFADVLGTLRRVSGPRRHRGGDLGPRRRVRRPERPGPGPARHRAGRAVSGGADRDPPRAGRGLRPRAARARRHAAGGAG